MATSCVGAVRHTSQPSHTPCQESEGHKCILYWVLEIKGDICQTQNFHSNWRKSFYTVLRGNWRLHAAFTVFYIFSPRFATFLLWYLIFNMKTIWCVFSAFIWFWIDLTIRLNQDFKVTWGEQTPHLLAGEALEAQKGLALEAQMCSGAAKNMEV